MSLLLNGFVFCPGREKLHLQGLQFKQSMLAPFSESTLSDLAGNGSLGLVIFVFSSFCVAAYFSFRVVLKDK